MISPKKTFFFDLDGTIVNDSSNDLCPNILETLTKIKEKGNNISFATGRTLIESIELIQLVNPTLPVICMDGRLVYDYKNNDLLLSYPLEETHLSAIRKSFQNKCYIFEEYPLTITAPDSISALLFTMSFKVKRNFVKVQHKSFSSPPLRIYLCHKDYKSNFNKEDYRLMKKVLGEHVEVYKVNDKWIVIKVAHIDKYHGLLSISKKYSLSMRDITFFGNGDNDILLFKHVGTSVAMLNSPQNVKEHAQIVAGDIKETGVLTILKDLGHC
ncbi:HAD family phosphatase [Priestia filamentosa]|uniref:HAD-IIB family hydrolase n=1 Tax=Priestia filamentosa TaxID=1402861 RepID=UPI001FB1AE10|nr:HAD family hydrolase [Priestia filamentosa]UOE58277.1 HAD family phosphatase [Priestia filamentosa]